MTNQFAIRNTACVAALLTATGAMADVSAQQVWDDWSSNFDLYGTDAVTVGSENFAGGTLTVTDLTFSMDDPSGAVVTGTIGEISLAENGDGTVTITMTPETSITVDNPREGLEMEVGLRMQDVVIVASGDATTINYEMTAGAYQISLDRIVGDGEVIPAVASFVMSDISGNYSSTQGNLRSLAYDMSVGNIGMVVNFANPDNAEENFSFEGDIAGMDIVLNMAIPNDFDPNAPETMFVNGFSIDGAYSLGASTYNMVFNDRYDAFSADVAVGSGQLGFAFDMSGFAYDVTTTDLAMNLQTSEFPFPIAVSAAEYGIGVQMPLARTDAPAPFRMGVNIIDLAINDEIWGLADPSGVLPRTPATITGDITGTAKLFFDILDPAQADQFADADIPGELHTLNMSNLLISFAGAEVTGEAAFTVDNSTPSPGLGLPMKPVGAVTINASGINGLLNNFVQMGLIGQGEVSQAQLMMGLFAQSTGEDSISTSLEINDEGHVLANGQRIQ